MSGIGFRSWIGMFVLVGFWGLGGVALGGPVVGIGDRGSVPNGDLVLLKKTLQPKVLNIEDFGAVEGGRIDARGAIQAAIDMASVSEGVTVFVPAGLYRVGGELLMRSNVTIKGVGDASVLYADGDWNLFLYVGTWQYSIVNTVIQDLHLRGTGVPSEHFSTLIAMREYVKDAVIDSCLLTDSGYDGWYALHEVSGVRVTNNRVLNCLDDGLNPGGRADGDGTHDILIQGNTIKSVGHDGIHISNGTYDITVIDNTIFDSDVGIGFFRSNFAEVRGNTIVRCGTGIRTHAGRPTGIDIVDNLITDSATAGINFTGNRALLQGNVVIDSGGHGIYLNETNGRNTDVVVESNIVERSWLDGIRLELDCGVVTDNFVREAGGVSIYDANRYSRVLFNDVDGGVFNFPGDTNCDQSIDGLDVDLVWKMWGVCDHAEGVICHADVNGDGVVDMADIDIVTQNFGR